MRCNGDSEKALLSLDRKRLEGSDLAQEPGEMVWAVGNTGLRRVGRQKRPAVVKLDDGERLAVWQVERSALLCRGDQEVASVTCAPGPDLDAFDAVADKGSPWLSDRDRRDGCGIGVHTASLSDRLTAVKTKQAKCCHFSRKCEKKTLAVVRRALPASACRVTNSGGTMILTELFYTPVSDPARGGRRAKPAFFACNQGF